MANNITISKGAFSVEIDTTDVAEGYTKKLVIIKPPQAKQKQSTGPAGNIIVDLLIITRVFSIKGEITGTDTLTAKQVRDKLKSIYNGGGINGGVETMVYDGESVEGFMEKLTITESSTDEASDFESNPEKYQEVPKYSVSFDFVEGTSR